MGYSKESERQNTALKDILKGKSPDKRILVAGVDKKFKKEMEEKRAKELKDNSDRADVFKDARTPLWCPSCKNIMKKRIDTQYYNRHGHCLDCQVEFENKLAVQGKLTYHVEETVKENKKAYIRELKQSIEEWKEAPDTVSFFNQVKPDGYSLDEEQWEVDKDHINKEIEEAEKYLKKLEESI